jgi:hypothetical protein
MFLKVKHIIMKWIYVIYPKSIYALYVGEGIMIVIKLLKMMKKNYICEIHNEIYVSYSKSCKSNICLKCEKNI